MTMTLAVAGKGGVGKTTFAALLIHHIATRNLGSILAIDGDPSSNLNLALGVELGETVGRIREDTRIEVSSGRYDASIAKSDFFEYEIYDALVEGERFDLLAMGRPEGPGCYCAANNILRGVVDRLGDQYDYVVIDNEAGMEHISRQTTRDVDGLFILTDMTMRGLNAAGHIARLIRELGTRVYRTHLVINRSNGEIPAVWNDTIADFGLELLGTLPDDPAVAEFDLVGRPIIHIGEDTSISLAVSEIASRAGVE